MINTQFFKLQRRDWADWGVILLAISGLPGCSILPDDLVRSFADKELEKVGGDEPGFGEIAELSLFGKEHLDDARKNVA